MSKMVTGRGKLVAYLFGAGMFALPLVSCRGPEESATGGEREGSVRQHSDTGSRQHDEEVVTNDRSWALDVRSLADAATDQRIAMVVTVPQAGMLAVEVTDRVTSKLTATQALEEPQGTTRDSISALYPEQIYLLSAPVTAGRWSVEFSIKRLSEQHLRGLVSAMWGDAAGQRRKNSAEPARRSRGIEILQSTIVGDGGGPLRGFETPLAYASEEACKPGCGAAVVRAAGMWPGPERSMSSADIATPILIGSWWDADRLPRRPEDPGTAKAPVYSLWLHYFAP